MAMVLPMRIWMLTGLLAGCLATTSAGAQDVAELEAAIPGPVKALGEPAMTDFPGGIRMAVTAATKKAQDHVNQGLNHLHGGWEFEASRHFAAAMREDPECLLAHWGMVMCLLTPSPETGDARIAATDRLMALIENGQGSALERGYAYGIVKYIESGPGGAAEAFAKVAAKFPNELQAKVFSTLFNRGGYDELGLPTPAQEHAETELLALIEKYPDSPVPVNALLFIRAEAPDLQPSLVLARRLSKMAPNYPPYFHMLGHYEWRCGNHSRAATAFGRASSFYRNWMRQNNAGFDDCPEWGKAECYRIVSLVSKGDFDTAYAASRQVAATPLSSARPSSPGNRFAMWDAKTLPARVLLHRGLRGNAVEAANSLPSPEEIEPFRAHSLAYWWIDGLRFVLEAQRLIDAGEYQKAREVTAAIAEHGERMAATQDAAAKGGERSSWLRAFRALEVLASNLRGHLAMNGPDSLKGTAYNWFASAADRQHVDPMLYPPMILTPMASGLGDYFLGTGENKKAIEAYDRALRTFPYDQKTLKKLLDACIAAKEDERAVEIQKIIDRHAAE